MDIIDRRLIQGLHVERLRRAGAWEDEHLQHVIFQASSIDALLDGAYDGDLTFAELAAHGDFGIGTRQQLDGEMVALDGEFWSVSSDGIVHRVPPQARTPFAVVLFFAPGPPLALAGPLNHAALKARIDAAVPRDAVCIALRVRGRFAAMRVRSVPRQSPPYPPLAEVAARQVEFELSETTGTLVGFRFPDYAQGLEVAGYHLHYLSDDRRHGGHVLDFTLRDGVAEWDLSSEMHLEVPAGLTASGPDTSTAKRELLRRTEGGR
jgi:acetolactate decarboxylase